MFRFRTTLRFDWRSISIKTTQNDLQSSSTTIRCSRYSRLFGSTNQNREKEKDVEPQQQKQKSKKLTRKPLSPRFKSIRSEGEDVGSEGRMLTLEHFLLRDKSVKLWRDFIRASRNIPNPIARRETVDWLRDEHFEGPSGLRKEYDLARIRELLVFGNVALKRVCGPMELVAALNPKHGSFPKLRGRRDLTSL